MQKFFSMLSVVAVMFAFVFAMTPQVAQAFDTQIEVKSIKFKPEKNAVRVVLKFVNNEDRPMQFWNFNCTKFAIKDPSGNEVFNSNGSFTVNVDSKGDFIVPAHGTNIFGFTISKKRAPGMTDVPNATYDYNAGWRLSWSQEDVHCNYAQ